MSLAALILRSLRGEHISRVALSARAYGHRGMYRRDLHGYPVGFRCHDRSSTLLAAFRIILLRR